jgi:hypothetical protein
MGLVAGNPICDAPESPDLWLTAIAGNNPLYAKWVSGLLPLSAILSNGRPEIRKRRQLVVHADTNIIKLQEI